MFKALLKLSYIPINKAKNFGQFLPSKLGVDLNVGLSQLLTAFWSAVSQEDAALVCMWNFIHPVQQLDKEGGMMQCANHFHAICFIHMLTRVCSQTDIL